MPVITGHKHYIRVYLSEGPFESMASGNVLFVGSAEFSDIYVDPVSSQASDYAKPEIKLVPVSEKRSADTKTYLTVESNCSSQFTSGGLGVFTADVA
jgi:hypothetical protein